MSTLEGDAVSVTRMISPSSMPVASERLAAPVASPTPPPPAAAPTLPSNAARLSGRVKDKAWEVLTSVKDTLLQQADKTVIEQDELTDQRARAISAKNWSKEQQSQLEEGLKKHATGDLTPAAWDEIATGVEGKTGIECFDRYNLVMAALKKRGDSRPPPPAEPARQPAASSSGLTTMFSSLFGAVKTAVAGTTFADAALEAATHAPAAAVFNTVAPALFRLSEPLADAVAAVTARVPVLLWDSAAQKWAGQLSVASVLMHSASAHDSLGATVAELTHEELYCPLLPVIILSPFSTGRDVLRAFLEPVTGLAPTHVFLAGESGGVAPNVTRSISQAEVLRFVSSVLRVEHPAPRHVPHVSVHDDELLLSAVRALALRRANSVSVTAGGKVVGELSVAHLEAAGLAACTAALKKPVSAFLAAHKGQVKNVRDLQLLAK